MESDHFFLPPQGCLANYGREVKTSIAAKILLRMIAIGVYIMSCGYGADGIFDVGRW